MRRSTKMGSRGRRDQLARTEALHGGAYVVRQHDLQPVFDLLSGVEVLGGTLKQCSGLIIARHFRGSAACQKV